MELQNKYYTPEIEEFHVGFEYELLGNSGNWYKNNFGDANGEYWNELSECYWDITHNKLRVKYLDQEDIESLGWMLDNNRYKEFNEKFWESYKLGNYYLTLGVYHSNINPYKILIDNGKYYDENETYFEGTIKNKSQLKFIMKCLGILE